ncbi:Hypothetical predicted protein, partial [Pelobates cultripes]
LRACISELKICTGNHHVEKEEVVLNQRKKVPPYIWKGEKIKSPFSSPRSCHGNGTSINYYNIINNKYNNTVTGTDSVSECRCNSCCHCRRCRSYICTGANYTQAVQQTYKDRKRAGYEKHQNHD